LTIAGLPTTEIIFVVDRNIPGYIPYKPERNKFCSLTEIKFLEPGYLCLLIFSQYGEKDSPKISVIEASHRQSVVQIPCRERIYREDALASEVAALRNFFLRNGPGGVVGGQVVQHGARKL
jgi:hypothetical protein